MDYQARQIKSGPARGGQGRGEDNHNGHLVLHGTNIDFEIWASLNCTGDSWALPVGACCLPIEILYPRHLSSYSTTSWIRL